MNEIILYGAGGHAKVIYDILRSQNMVPFCFFDDDESIKNFIDLKVYQYDPNFKETAELIISIGNNTLREKISEIVNHNFGKAVHSSSIISENSNIDVGTVVMHNSIIQSGTFIGKHCIINTSASVDHDCKVGDFTHISPNVTLCGEVSIGEGSLIGAGAVIIPSVTIGKNVTVGAGSVIIEDIPDYAVVVGNPGKIIKFNKK